MKSGFQDKTFAKKAVSSMKLCDQTPLETDNFKLAFFETRSNLDYNYFDVHIECSLTDVYNTTNKSFAYDIT